MTVVSLNKTSDNNNSFIKVLRIHTNVKFNLDILKLHLIEIYKLYGYYFFTPCCFLVLVQGDVHFKLVQYFFDQKMSVLEIPPSEDNY